MSNTIKSLVLTVLFMSVHSAVAGEVKLLTVKEFQQKINSNKLSQEDLSEFEINNEELITLYKIKAGKK